MKLEEKVEKMLRALPDDIESLEKEKALATKELKKAVNIPNTLPFTIATIVFAIIIGIYLLINECANQHKKTPTDGSLWVSFWLIITLLCLSIPLQIY